MATQEELQQLQEIATKILQVVAKMQAQLPYDEDPDGYLDVRCPFCGALPGESCRIRATKVEIPHPHTSRVKLKKHRDG